MAKHDLMHEQTFFTKEDNDLTCVIICAGKGRRILPNSKEIPKTMILLNEKPILHYIVEYWRKYTNNFLFIVGYKKDHIITYASQLDIQSKFIEQKELKGIANAISHAKEAVSDNFIVVLGDCLCRGTFSPLGRMIQGIGVWKTESHEYIQNNYAVVIEEDKLSKVIEKPQEIYNNFCGMGVYFFNKKIFHYIEKTPPSILRYEIEITDVIQTMIDSHERITPVFFNGEYLNITFPKDITIAEELLRKNP
jgi:dTDP-glucose pyrophosphorylase